MNNNEAGEEKGDLLFTVCVGTCIEIDLCENGVEFFLYDPKDKSMTEAWFSGQDYNSHSIDGDIQAFDFGKDRKFRIQIPRAQARNYIRITTLLKKIEQQCEKWLNIQSTSNGVKQ